jgi:signal transduction histidine kinase
MALVKNKLCATLLNPYLICAILTLAALYLPALGTQTPAGVRLILDARVSYVDSKTPPNINDHSWQSTNLPIQAKHFASNTPYSMWVEIEIDQSDLLGNHFGILIPKLPDGGGAYIDGVELFNAPGSTPNQQVKLHAPLISKITIDKTKEKRLLLINIHPLNSLGDLGPIYIGNTRAIFNLMLNYYKWDEVYPKTIGIISLIFTAACLILALRNKNLSMLWVVFTTSLLGLVWQATLSIENLPLQFWLGWKLSAWALFPALIYCLLRLIFFLAKVNLPLYVKVFLPLIAILGSITFFLDEAFAKQVREGLFLSLSLLLGLVLIQLLMKSVSRKSWDIFCIAILFATSSLTILNDALSMSGMIVSLNPILRGLGVAEFHLAVNLVSYLLAGPYLLTLCMSIFSIFQNQQKMEAHIANAIKLERSTILRDLHDGLGSTLTLASIQAQTGRLTLEGAKTLLNNSLDDLRLIINGSPNGYADLPAMISIVASQVKAIHGEGGGDVEILTDLPNPNQAGPPLSSKNAISLAYAIREALTNSLKHSDANQIKIKLHYANSRTYIQLSDNSSTGFNVEAQQSIRRGNGLKNLRARVYSMNGDIEIKSSAGGTHISIDIPEQRFQQ